MSESESVLLGTLEQVVSACKAVPLRSDLSSLLDDVNAAQARGYFLPDEDERIRDAYQNYLRVRAVLLESVASLEPHCYDRKNWVQSLRVFAVAYTAACVLMRAAEFVVDLADDRFLVWKKLDEEELRYGIKQKSFTNIYKSLTSSRRMWRFYEASRFFEANAEDVLAFEKEGGLMTELIEVLRAELPFVQRQKAEYVRRQFQYRLFSFRQKSHSGYRKVMFHMFQISGRAIAEMRQPHISLLKAGKRVTPRVMAKAWSLLQPGDVIITRHDDALSNLFLPGFWPHAAFYIGSEEQRKNLGVSIDAPEGVNVVEAKKDGVKFRTLSETLAVDAFVILRPNFKRKLVREAVEKAMGHTGKRYDFIFDFRQSDRLACTEVVYRSYQSVGAVDFNLQEYAGRQCLSAENLINQAVGSGAFKPVAIYGVTGIKVHEGEEAMKRLERSYDAAWLSGDKSDAYELSSVDFGSDGVDAI